MALKLRKVLSVNKLLYFIQLGTNIASKLIWFGLEMLIMWEKVRKY